jgi:hypothetical protein
MQNGIVILDADGSIQPCNGSAERILETVGGTDHEPAIVHARSPGLSTAA